MDKSLNVVEYDDGVRALAQRGEIDSVVLWPPTWPESEPKSGQINKKAWHKFDEQLENAQEDGCPVYVSAWSNVPKRASEGRNQPPTDRTVEGPWASDYIGFLGARVVERHPGVVKGIIVMNETNIEYCGDPDVAPHTAEMAISAEEVLYEAGYKGMMLMPAASDEPGFEEFIDGVLYNVMGWKPHLEIGIAHHTHKDCTEGTTRRAEYVVERVNGLYKCYWTECGYKFKTHSTGIPDEFAYTGPLGPQEKAQLRNCSEHFDWSKGTKRVSMWANYGLRDKKWGGDGYMSSLDRIDSTPHPWGRKWRTGGG
jgi:hypothetical protein